MPGATPIEAGTELDYLLRCVADGLGTLATQGYAKGDADRGGREPRTIECVPFNGRFTAEELKRAAAKSPGMRVSIGRVSKIAHVGNGQVDLTLEVRRRHRHPGPQPRVGRRRRPHPAGRPDGHALAELGHLPGPRARSSTPA